MRAIVDPGLDAVLKETSRSFYLSLVALPRSVRGQLSLAYLVARAADTIADTEALPRERRRELLAELGRGAADSAHAAHAARAIRQALAAAPPDAGERRLLEELGRCLPLVHALAPFDLAATQKVLATLIRGMDKDLERFSNPTGALAVLETLADLDEYCYLAAGCVGEYWTELTRHHVAALAPLPAHDMLERGCRLGKALQLINVLRDAPRDLANGRCYWPRELLEAHGLTPEDLRTPAERGRARPVLAALHALALGHFDAAWPYVLAIPAREPRLRLAALWPMWIGLETLALLRSAPDPLDPSQVLKVGRPAVYRILAESSALCGVELLLELGHDARRWRAR